MHIGNISNIFSFERQSTDPGSPRKNKKAKSFGHFVKSLKNDAFASLNEVEKHIQFDYTLHQQRLEQVQSAKYLGITISDDLDWGQHISEISA